MRQLCLILIGVVVLATYSGCPDYSHLRSTPDYENMTDTGSEEK